MAKILVVEDDTVIRNLILFQLQDKQHQVLEASNGKQGLLLAQTETPDLIIMDLRMPVMDGWQATETLKSHPETRGIPILALSAQSHTSARLKFTDVNCDGYIQKPIDFTALFAQIESLTNTSIIA